MRRVEPEQSPPSKLERRGSFIAHGSVLLIGVPLTIFLLPIPFSIVPCPVVAYMISRSFRRRRLAWGAFQGMQASVVQSMIVLLATAIVVAGLSPRLALTLGTAGFLLFLYSLWGALDTLLGYDFRYAGIGDMLDRVSQANLERQERASRWFGRKGPDRNDR